MEKIFENKSLNFICNSIDMGLVEFDSVENIQIVSKLKPEFVVKLIDIDITNYVFDMVAGFDEQSKVNQCETNFHTYIVFTTLLEETEKGPVKTLISISLLELITVSKNLSSVDFKNDEVNDNKYGNWSLDSEEWDLIIIK